MALSPQFAKAHSRLATLLAELGYHDDAATALEAAAEAPGVSRIGGCRQPGVFARCLCAPADPASPPPFPLQVSSSDRRGYQQRLQSERTAAKRAASRSGGLGGQQAPLDHYKLLGLERTTTAEEVGSGGCGGGSMQVCCGRPCHACVWQLTHAALERPAHPVPLCLPAQVRRTYKKLALQLHPDKAGRGGAPRRALLRLRLPHF